MKKLRAKEIVLVLVIFAVPLFIIVGGSAWRNGNFDNTVMTELFPALFWGLMAGIGMLLILSNIFKDSPIVWCVGGLIALFTVTILRMSHADTASIVVLLSIFGGCILMGIIKGIANL